MSRAATAPSIDNFVAAIRPSLESDAVSAVRLGEFAVDGMTPEIAVTPNSVEQLQRVLTEAREARLATVAIGGGTHLGAGNAPAAYDVAISTARLDTTFEHEPADLTVTVDAGVRLALVQARLAEHGQTLPLDPPCGDDATIGGVLAANAHGPLRHAYGTARDWLIGIRVVHADGATSKSGGRVVKNVAGYDMHKLYVGSLGTLGVIAQATFKLAPLPRAQTTAAVAFGTAREACAFVIAARDAGLSLHAAELLSPPAAHAVMEDARWIVLARVAGGAAGVERSLRELAHLAEETRAGIDEGDGAPAWQRWSRAFRPGVLSLRVSVMPSAIADTVEVLDRGFAGAAAQMSATVTAGLIRINLEPSHEARAAALVARAHEVAARAGGTVSIDAAPAVLKREIDVFGPLRPDFAIMRRLKEQFDPQGVLSPGRFAGRL
jgi:glycolate oxidase FAD binding subunit